MVECMFDLRASSGRDATWGTDPLGRVHLARWRASDRPGEGELRLDDSVALEFAGEQTVPVTHRNHVSGYGADESSAP